jgi:hypothetical protein
MIHDNETPTFELRENESFSAVCTNLFGLLSLWFYFLIHWCADEDSHLASSITSIVLLHTCIVLCTTDGPFGQ